MTKPSAFPPLRELGQDLLHLTLRQRIVSLASPFAWCAAYFLLAALDCWSAAVLALVALSFVTYGSVSHDLVHRNLGLPPWLNDVLVCAIELLALRSGHAYQAAHLQHHARFPHPDDVEAAIASRSLLGALAEGIIGQFRIGWWALKNAKQSRTWIIGEGIVCLALISGAALSYWFTPILLIYALLLVMGSWIIPLVTSYVPHDPDGPTELMRTRAFRGVVASILALEHLYHLEHHLYPSVPHHHWPTLAKRLDPYFERAGVKPIRFWF
jgi:beta-carotene hydroxylase